MTTGSDTRVTKAAIVTGSATVIGAAVARALASRGWGVAIERFKAGLEATLPLGRMPSADDVAETVLRFLTAGRAVTGQLLVVDSGEHMAGGIAPGDG